MSDIKCVYDVLLASYSAAFVCSCIRTGRAKLYNLRC